MKSPTTLVKNSVPVLLLDYYLRTDSNVTLYSHGTIKRHAPFEFDGKYKYVPLSDEGNRVNVDVKLCPTSAAPSSGGTTGVFAMLTFGVVAVNAIMNTVNNVNSNNNNNNNNNNDNNNNIDNINISNNMDMNNNMNMIMGRNSKSQRCFCYRNGSKVLGEILPQLKIELPKFIKNRLLDRF